ncbi:hypothetical protein KW795_01180 [Candidatus Microgenomates bacterium]|nr:hypothetical protein [Candidatus Microgenomates bacterium]
MSEMESIEKLQEEEKLRVRMEAEIEFSWWCDRLISDTTKAIENKELIRVPNESGKFRLIRNLREEKELPYLNHDAFGLLTLLNNRISERLRLAKANEQIYYSISSLYRDHVFQTQLVQAGENAADISTHEAGASFDIDPNGYYLGPEKTPINRSNPLFRPEYISIMVEVLEGLKQEGICNVIVERKYSTNEKGDIASRDACLHVCVKPEID